MKIKNTSTYSYKTSLPPSLAISHILLNPIGSSANPLGSAVPAIDKNVVPMPMATMALSPPTALIVAQVTHMTAVIRPANGFVTENAKLYQT